MAISVQLYNITDEPNKLEKTLPLSSDTQNYFTTQCTLKDPQSIMNIELKLSGTPTRIANKNYLRLPVLTGVQRYYFITDITSIPGYDTGNYMWIIKGRLDPLMTYADDIKNLTGIVDRQENQYNLYLNDPMVPKMSYPLIQHKAFPTSITTSDYNFYLITAGG